MQNQRQFKPSAKPEKVTPIKPAYIPPANPEAEQSVLGAILVRPEVLDQVAVLITPADFYREAHGRIFQAMLDLRNAGKPVDLVSVTALLKERGQLEGMGGPVFLAALSEEVGFAVNAEYYAKLVHDKARLRRFLDKTQQVSAACFGPVENTSQFLDQAMQELYEVAGTGAHHQVFPLDNLVKSETQVIEQIYEKHQQPGIPPGYHDLGKLFSWVPGDLVILAARPSMGKTALALNFTWRIAQNGIPGLVFTLETSKEQITRRFMSLVGRINGHRMNQGKLTDEEWERFYQIQDQVNQMPILIDDTPSLSVAEIRARTRRQFGNGSPGFVVVDYLQLTKPLRRGRSREEEVAEVSRGLKALAKELNVPVLAISSLNRKLEERPDKRPQLADLRESGAIEFDADVILFLYRDEVYKKETPAAGVAEVNVAKHKNGPIGTVKLAYQKEVHRFEDLADHPEEPPF